MAEPRSTMRRISSPCFFSLSTGPLNAAPTVRFGRPDSGDRAFFVISTAELLSEIAPHRGISGAIVRIESPPAPELRVTTSGATGKLTAAAECS